MSRHFGFRLVATISFLAALNIPLTPGIAAIPLGQAVLAPDAFGYADLADLFAESPLALRVRIDRATALKGAAMPAGRTRFYLEGTVIALIRGTQGIAPRVAWVVDLPRDSRGRLPRLRKTEVLLAALPVANRPGEIRLAAPDAQLPWGATLEARVRAIAAAAVAPGAPPAITGITSAFHSAGTVIGEGETQIFLSTVNKAPVSLTVLSRPGQARRWAFAQSEIVDDAAEPPARETLAWYRLACFLPSSLPEAAVAELSAADRDAARADYAFVIEAMGPCPRVRQR